uniref:uncharacterized protein isoform X3 n=1 Tax=Myxine glutinosa TaxID=7769 RepID=UPI00358FA071
MDRDISGKDLTVDTAGTTCGSTGGNTLDPRGCRAECGSRGGEHEDKDKVPDFIVKVKVESEFVDVFASQVEDHDLKMKVDPELLDCTIKREDHRVKTECFQSDGFETSQEVSSNCHVKAEPPGSPNEETSDAALMREGGKHVDLRWNGIDFALVCYLCYDFIYFIYLFGILFYG